MSKHTTVDQLKKLAQRTKTELTALETKLSTGIDAAFKSLKVEGSTVSFYTTADMTGTAAATMDFPAEYFLDQAKTNIVPVFAWAEANYPGSTNPNLDGKPVLVLAVKGDDGSVSYSFLNMEKLMNIYTAKTEGKDASTTVIVDGYTLDVKVKISAAEDNQLQLKDDGLFVPAPAAIDLSGKADKVASAVAGNLAGLDTNGNLTDSGKKAGGATMATAPNANTLATEAAVKAFVNANTATDTEVDAMLTEVFGAA